jgi:hypothetical protein
VPLRQTHANPPVRIPPPDGRLACPQAQLAVERLSEDLIRRSTPVTALRNGRGVGASNREAQARALEALAAFAADGYRGRQAARTLRRGSILGQ